MANFKKSLMFTQVPCEIFSADQFRRLVRRARHANFTEEMLAQMRLIILVVWLVINRSPNGYYVPYDADFVGVVAEDSNIDDADVEKIIQFLVAEKYYNGDLFHSDKVITSFEIQEAYFTVMSRLKRILPPNLPYLLVNIDNRTDSAKESRESSEICALTSVGMALPSKESGHTSEASIHSSEERSNLLNNDVLLPKKVVSNSNCITDCKESYMDSIYRCCATEKCEYNNKENYQFYLIMFMENVKDPAKATDDFITYNQAQGWTSPKNGTKYDTPKARLALAKQFARNPKTPRGRLVSHDKSHNKINEAFLLCLYDLYTWAQGAQYDDLPAYVLMNANSHVVLTWVADNEYDIELATGPKAKLALEAHVEEIRPIIAKRFHTMREIRFVECSNTLKSMKPIC